jgi:hypothetical protein
LKASLAKEGCDLESFRFFKHDNDDKFNIELYLNKCDWFDLKNGYYSRMNRVIKGKTETEKSSNKRINDTIIEKMKNALKILNLHRLASIKNGIKKTFGDLGEECLTLEEFGKLKENDETDGTDEVDPNEVTDESDKSDESDQNDINMPELTDQLLEKLEVQYEILNLKNDSFRWVFVCSTYTYILTSFGSQTLTSDFDFSIYRFLIKDKQTNAEDELIGIREITTKINFLNRYIKYHVCFGQTMQKCFDSNGYPEIMVYYNTYFKNKKIQNENDMIEAVYGNLVSSKVIRFCVVSQIYFARFVDKLKSSQVHAYFYEMFFNC